MAGKYQQALDKYNQSLALAEEAGGPSSLGVVLGNRSAALYHLRQYAACVQDVDTALARLISILPLRDKVPELANACIDVLKEKTGLWESEHNLFIKFKMTQ